MFSLSHRLTDLMLLVLGNRSNNECEVFFVTYASS